MYPDIKSIYSRENSYTVLQLLEELIKDVNAVQYTSVSVDTTTGVITLTYGE